MGGRRVWVGWSVGMGGQERQDCSSRCASWWRDGCSTSPEVSVGQEHHEPPSDNPRRPPHTLAQGHPNPPSTPSGCVLQAPDASGEEDCLTEGGVVKVTRGRSRYILHLCGQPLHRRRLTSPTIMLPNYQNYPALIPLPARDGLHTTHGPRKMSEFM